MPEQLIVNDGQTKEVCSVEETVETSSTTFARVQGDTISGWVEVPDNPATPNYVVICDDCGHFETREVQGIETEVLVDAKHNEVHSESNADLLRDIHESLRPTHNPRTEVSV